MLRRGGDQNHHLGAVQGREDIGLVLRTRLILQCDPGEEHPSPLLGELVVDVLGEKAVPGAGAVVLGLLVADKHVEGLLVLGGGEDAPLDLGNLLSVLLVLPSRDAVRMLQGCQVVHVLQEAVEAGPVAGGEVLQGVRVLHILDAEPAQGAAPVGLGVSFVLLYDLFIDGQRLVEFPGPSELIAAVEPVGPLLVVHLGEGHDAAAGIAGPKGTVRGKLNVASAHLAFQDHGHTSNHQLSSVYRIRQQMTRENRI